MNEQLQQALVKLIEKANSGVDASISFLSDQLPDVVHQLLTWGLLSSALTCVVCILLVIASCVALKKAGDGVKESKQSKKDNWAYQNYSWGCGTVEEPVIVIITLSIVFCSISLIVFTGSLFDALKIVFAPKIWLIEYAATLAK